MKTIAPVFAIVALAFLAVCDGFLYAATPSSGTLMLPAPGDFHSELVSGPYTALPPIRQPARH